MPSPRRGAAPTRALLVCAALAGVQTVLQLSLLPALSVLAPASPPLYALIASAHTLLPFLARRLTRMPGAATLTSGIAGIFVAATSALGIVALIPLLVAGVVIDAIVWSSDAAGRRRESRFLVAGVAAGLALWAVSLSVFSPEHLVPAILLGTLGARVVGELVVVVLSRVLAAALERAGVGRSSGRGGQAFPGSRPDGSGAQPNGSGDTGSS